MVNFVDFIGEGRGSQALAKALVETERRVDVLSDEVEGVTPDIGRPFYQATTAIDALALIGTPPDRDGAEGGSSSLQRWRRRELNPRPRSRERWRLRA